MEDTLYQQWEVQEEELSWKKRGSFGWMGTNTPRVQELIGSQAISGITKLISDPRLPGGDW